MTLDTINNCLVIAPEKSSSVIQERLKSSYSIILKDKFHGIEDALRNNRISCIIIDITALRFNLYELSLSKLNFALIPIICLIQKVDLEFIMQLGNIGIEKALMYDQLEKLLGLVNEITFQISANVKCHEIGIEIDYYNANLKKIIQFIEKNYITIMSMTEVEQFIGLSDNFISREFKRHELPTPKKILLLFKIMHAIKLMNNRGLGLKQIALYSGFSCEKRFNEGFHRVFACAPSSFRTAGRHNNINSKGLFAKTNLAS